ncbi:Alpha/Beta hydrolase protein [Scenedesmus sp. NREL 46B-D3]|nr:Alpha/Beta hydrolase protein [Scenedesmus sp. NREL 46B-D3]
MAAPAQISANKCCGGYNRRYKHASSTLHCDMTFTVYFPPAADETAASPTKVPVLYYLSGLTCTDENVIQKSGWCWLLRQRHSRQVEEWRMYDYITKELPALLAASFPTLDTATASIMGHSMGGHGALTLALKNPGAYKSLSAFSPICNPCNVPWGVKAFTGYFGACTCCVHAMDSSHRVDQCCRLQISAVAC